MNYEEIYEQFYKYAGLKKGKGIKEQLIDSIKTERKSKAHTASDAFIAEIEGGNHKRAELGLVLLTPPKQFVDVLERLRKDIDRVFPSSNFTYRFYSFLFLNGITLNLGSHLPSWNLTNSDLYPDSIVTEEQINHQIDKNRDYLKKWVKEDGELRKQVLDYYSLMTKERLKSEEIEEDQISEFAHDIVGGNIDHYIDQIFSFIERSNLGKITSLRNSYDTVTEIGNDYAAHLAEVMWLGASFVTTNPQLAYVNYKRKLDIKDSQIDNLISTFIVDRKMKNKNDITQEMIEELTDFFTAEVVINNAELLRNIFLLTDGKKGYVCLQVNPIYHGDTDRMVTQALRIFFHMYQRFGGMPNVVFKLPGTKAGLKAQEVLTGLGIGANITVEFGLFQVLPFAKAINSTSTIASHLTLMNGRLAFPVRDELISMGVKNAAEAAQWAGVAVGKKAFDMLYSKDKLGFDPSCIKLLIASLRNYNNFFPDITELLGAPIITVFPNIRNQFDSIRCDMDPKAIEKPVDGAILKTLSRSEIFKQAYYLPGDRVDFKPETVLSLENTSAVENWTPVKATLDAFIQARKMTEQALRKRAETIMNS